MLRDANTVNRLQSPIFAEGPIRVHELDRFPFANTRQKHLDDLALRFSFLERVLLDTFLL